MKVLLVSFLMDPRQGGGAATSAMRLARGLVEQGIEVVGLTSHGEGKPRVTVEDGIKIYAFRPRNLYWVEEKDTQPVWKKIIWQGIDTWNPSTYRYMREVIRTEKPDVIHVQKLRGLSPSIWSAAAAENCRPIVQTCRDYELISPEGLLDSRVGRLALQRHWTMRPYQSLRARWSNLVDVATAPSRFTLDTITGMGFFAKAHQIVVPNTHGLSDADLRALAAREPHHSHAAGLRLLYLGRLESEKGINVLCQAFAAMAEESAGISLDIAGDGTREAVLRAEYAGVPGMRFHGHVAGKAKEDLIAEAGILVMPSVVNEVFGNSIIEAYAHGKPVIASRIGGMPELIREGETGILVEPGNANSLQSAIRSLQARPAAVAAMEDACRKAARQYTLEAVTKAYLNAYETGNPNRGRSRQFNNTDKGQTAPHNQVK